MTVSSMNANDLRIRCQIRQDAGSGDRGGGFASASRTERGAPGRRCAVVREQLQECQRENSKRLAGFRSKCQLAPELPGLSAHQR